MDFNLLASAIIKIFYGFINSPFFLTLKFLLAIYVTVLFADILMLVFFRGRKDIRTTFKGMNIPLVSPRKMRKKWDKIKFRLESREASQYKLAIIEADRIVDKILEDMNLKGENMTERLNNLRPEQVENLEDLKRAHKARNQIINDQFFEIDGESSKEILGIYEYFLIYFKFLED